MQRNPGEIIRENRRRVKALKKPYDPIRGIGSPVKRFRFTVKKGDYYYLPNSMKTLPVVRQILKSKSVYQYLRKISDDRPPTDKEIQTFLKALWKIRKKHDFEYWAATNIKIQDKESLAEIPLILKRGQRKLLKYLENQRLKGVPIRGVIDKARQWGGSTLTEFYMKWIATEHRRNWHMAVIAQDDSAARNIREMYVRAANAYPKSEGTITLKPYAGSSKNLICKEHGGIVGVGSVENPKQFRSYNYPMAHLSEVGIWSETTHKSAKQLAQGLKATVPSVPYSVIIEESTAKGVGNYFHDEWLAAEAGKSGYFACFVAWYEHELNERHIPNHQSFVDEMIHNENFIPEMDPDYHWFLWDQGATLEQINWYRWYMTFENRTAIEMFEEYPTNAAESFVSSGRRAFPVAYVEKARKTCKRAMYRGEIHGDARSGKSSLKNVKIEKVTKGNFSVWEEPDLSEEISNRYLVVMDIGGTTKRADYTVIRVFDRYWKMFGGVMEVVASWRGHIDQDLGAWKAAQIAHIYGDALLVIERNSLREKDKEEQDMDHSLTVLDEIADHYENLYARNIPDNIREGKPLKYGWFTDKRTKPLVIDTLKKSIREGLYIERDKMACDEMDTFEQKPDGSYGAIEGKHDDIVMVDAIGTHIDQSYMDAPKKVVHVKRKIRGSIGESDF